MLTFAQFERELTSERTEDKILERAKRECGVVVSEISSVSPFYFKLIF